MSLRSVMTIAASIALSVSACAGPVGRSATEPPPPRTASVTAPTPTLDSLRRMLIEDGDRFRDLVRRLPDDTVTMMVNALPETTPDDKTFKARFQGATAGEVRTKLVDLTDSTSSYAARAGDGASNRRRVVSALPPSVLDKLVPELVALENDRAVLCANKSPRIHNIGLPSVLTYEEAKDDAPDRGQRAVRIPVDGRDLDPRCVKVGVLITGTVPLRVWGTSAADDALAEYKVDPPPPDRPDSFEVKLLKPFISRLSSGDQVTVQVTISQLHGSACVERSSRVVAYASRTFTMYSVSDYRAKVLHARIPAHDIRAFPLPDDEIEQLFGPLIAEQFYVVRLSIRNTENETKLISTGMITASGRALVETKTTECPQPAYTLPVTVIPSSLQQTFKILDDEESNQPRSWVFRSLEFAGALASAATAAFGFSLDVTKAVSLLTGVGIPEGKKLVPDRWPGYKSNVVAFAMQDLFKVPAISVSDHKLLFFSKKNLQGMIADQNFFIDVKGETHDASRMRQKFGFWTRNRAIPDVHVISLSFDNLDIRFEKVFEVGALTIKQRIAALIAAVPSRIDRLTGLDRRFAEGGRFDDTALTRTEWQRLRGLLEGAGTTQPLGDVYQAAVQTLDQTSKSSLESTPSDPSDLSRLIARLRSIVKAFDPTGTLGGYRKDLIASPEFGLNALEASQVKLNDLARALTAGPEPAAGDVAKIEAALESNKKAVDFYRSAAQLLLSEGLAASLQALRDSAQAVVTESGKTATTDADKTRVEQAKDAFKRSAAAAKSTLDQELKALQTLRPDGSLNLMSDVPWLPAAPGKQ